MTTPGLRSRKVGAAGRSFSARSQGYRINAAVSEHGYKFKLQAEIDFAALTDRQAQKVHKLLYEALTEALGTAAGMRAVHVPLFNLEDLQGNSPSTQGGINTR